MKPGPFRVAIEFVQCFSKGLLGLLQHGSWEDEWWAEAIKKKKKTKFNPVKKKVIAINSLHSWAHLIYSSSLPFIQKSICYERGRINYYTKHWGLVEVTTKPLWVVIHDKKEVKLACVNWDYAQWLKYSTAVPLSPAFISGMKTRCAEPRRAVVAQW